MTSPPVPKEPSSRKTGPWRLSLTPDLTAWPKILGLALAVGAVVSVVLALKLKTMGHYGDTDDAMRLVMVRDLLGGQGWYDPLIRRLQPPQGLFMHWSRLLDGGLAGSMAVLGAAMPAQTAELWVRVAWPLAWIFPAIGAGLVIARHLGDRAAVVLTAVLLATNLGLYQQFVPGRIDHHNIQIVMTLISLAGATAVSRARLWAVIAGVATGLGLAIGLEALAFEALIGASFALRLALNDRRAPAVGAYGVTLALTTATAFMIQTPPWRWSLSFCDALALNTVTALMIAGLGLGLAAWAATRGTGVLRVAILVGAGLAALGAYVALDPACVHGPFAHVDPLVRTLWLDRVQEVQPLWSVWRLSRDNAIQALCLLVFSSLGGFYLVLRQWPAPKAELILTLVVFTAATVMAVLVWRMMSYAFWVGVPLLGAAFSRLAARRLGNLLLPSVLMVSLLSPATFGAAAVAMVKSLAPRQHEEAWRRNLQACFAPDAFRDLAALPPGRVLSPPDIGPFILLFTPHSALTAPYHRMWRAMLLAHQALDGPAGADEARVRALGARYIVDCSGLALMSEPNGLDARLRQGQAPPWLRRLSPPAARLQIYVVTPPSS
jgi:hypothetical protein